VRHQVVKQPISELLHRAWIAGALPTLVREVPELRETLLQARVFLGPRRIPLYATLVALASRRGTLAFAGAAWWVGSREREATRAGGMRQRIAVGIPVELAVDCVTAVALLSGSARARTLVL